MVRKNLLFAGVAVLLKVGNEIVHAQESEACRLAETYARALLASQCVCSADQNLCSEPCLDVSSTQASVGGCSGGCEFCIRDETTGEAITCIQGQSAAAYIDERLSGSGFVVIIQSFRITYTYGLHAGSTFEWTNPTGVADFNNPSVGSCDAALNGQPCALCRHVPCGDDSPAEEGYIWDCTNVVPGAEANMCLEFSGIAEFGNPLIGTLIEVGCDNALQPGTGYGPATTTGSGESTNGPATTTGSGESTNEPATTSGSEEPASSVSSMSSWWMFPLSVLHLIF
jgi:hypothetical protein